MQSVVAQTKSIPNEIEAYLNKFIVDYNKGIQDADPQLFVKYYDKDIRLMPAFQKTLLGKENATIYHKAFFDRFDILEYKRGQIETLDLGAQLCVLGTFSMKVRLKNSVQIEELKGKYIDIWKKEGESLSLISEIWNYNHHTDLTEHLKFDNVPGTVLAYQGHLPVDNDIRFELAALNQFMEEFISQGDHKIWSQLYANDVIAMFSYKPIYRDKKSLDTFLEAHVAELPIFEKLDIRNDHIDDLGTYVVNYASHIANWRNDEYSGISTGKGIKIWRREPNGSLKIIRQIATYDYNY
ncbi:nuclear transport factor 2 family protein [Aquimarina sp. MMG016]|uniref:nuclear transport factor 2 family protein n=1 Tax=Aquimarina sp. MMG016 TaxID=2822690 RepID=UPI001B3A1586|nr:nuclear transport factor 2 family protein [Aquimarina sp. MMG016]MBQ4821646.1 nuclear transport factor 2 family protein [Aquimarina sp. MMG016]